ncbi:MAG: polysaccharide deacetylase family protein, partial [Dehalococcoidia bacterium]|nr:polysaccharide deacetylase family protein [Dehalococcoidia bacterium]
GRTKIRKGPVLRLALVVPIIVALIVVAQGYFVPGSTVFGKVYSKAKTNDKVIALTFDDGPNDPYTSRILDILDSQDIKATFFVTGKNVQMYPETAKRIVAEGHDLGNHSYSHNANHALTAQGGKDVLLAEQAIYDVTGVLPRFYRPPHGKKSPWELYSIRHAGLTLVNWSIATNELHTTNFSAVAAQIVKKAKPGGIIDLHDGYGNDHGTPLADKTLAVKALPIIIEDLRKEGYSFVTVSELLGQSPYKVAQ